MRYGLLPNRVPSAPKLNTSNPITVEASGICTDRDVVLISSANNSGLLACEGETVTGSAPVAGSGVGVGAGVG